MESSENFYLNDYTDFVNKASEIIKNDGNNDHYVIMYADLTNFQLINDFYGFIEGDRFLLEFANFLSKSPRTVLCGRVFSDHFLILSLFEDNCDLEAVTNDYQQKLEEFITLQEEHHPDSKVAVAAGLCRVKIEDSAIIKAIDQANIARKEAKKDNHCKMIWFNKDMQDYINNRKSLEIEIQNALRNKLFVFYLQPKVNINTGKIVGSEALARLIRGNEIIFPDQFIEIMEKNESIIELDFLICEQVCKYLNDRINQDKRLIPISMNMSRMHVYETNFVERINKIVDHYNIPPYLLEFELTETVVLKNLNKVREVADELRRYGYRVSIDDYGTGYSGMNIWQDLNFDIVKLDRSYITKRESNNNRNNIIIPAIVDICNKLQTTIICEGVETLDQCLYMKRFGCNVVQGYYFSKPVSVTEFDQLIDETKGIFKLPWDQEDFQHTSVDNISQSEIRAITNSIFNFVPGGVAGFSHGLELLFVSDSLVELTGYSRDELLSDGIEWAKKLFSSDEEFNRVFYHNGLDNRDTNNLVAFKIKNKNGKTLYINMYGGIIDSPEWGSYYLCCFYDVTNEKMNELKSLELQENINSLLNNIDGGIGKIQLDNQANILFASDGFYKAIGYSRNVFNQAPIYNNLSNIISNQNLHEYNQVIKQLQNRQIDCFEFEIIKKDNQKVWLTVFFSNIHLENEIIVSDVFCVNTSSDHQQLIMEQEYTKMENNLNIAIENTPGDIVVIKIKDNKVMTHFLSHGLARFYGYENGILDYVANDKDGFQFIYEKDREGLYQQCIEFSKLKKQVDFDYRAYYKDGKIGWHNIIANFYYQEDEGTIVYHGIITNINSIKEQQERAEQLKDRYNFILSVLAVHVWCLDLRKNELEILYMDEASSINFSNDKKVIPECLLENEIILLDDQKIYKKMLSDIRSGHKMVHDKLHFRIKNSKYNLFDVMIKVDKSNPDIAIIMAKNFDQFFN